MPSYPGFGPSHPLPLSELLPEEQVLETLTKPGAVFEFQEKLIKGRLVKVWKVREKVFFAASFRDFLTWWC